MVDADSNELNSNSLNIAAISPINDKSINNFIYEKLQTPRKPFDRLTFFRLVPI